MSNNPKEQVVDWSKVTVSSINTSPNKCRDLIGEESSSKYSQIIGDEIFKNSRKSKIDYYLSIARQVATRGTCLRRNYGAVIVKNDEIISTGYTGSPRGCDNCSDIGMCIRNELNIPGKERYELCKSVHAEMNAIISASRKDMIGATLYLVGLNPDSTLHTSSCCLLCQKMIINSGIKNIICQKEDGSFNEYTVNDFLKNINDMNRN